jgi:hypothetical protein
VIWIAPGWIVVWLMIVGGTPSPGCGGRYVAVGAGIGTGTGRGGTGGSPGRVASNRSASNVLLNALGTLEAMAVTAAVACCVALAKSPSPPLSARTMLRSSSKLWSPGISVAVSWLVSMRANRSRRPG